MAKTIVIDSVDLVELRIVKQPNDPDKLQIYARYNLLSAGDVVQTQYREITRQLSLARQGDAADLFGGAATDLTSAELA